MSESEALEQWVDSSVPICAWHYVPSFLDAPKEEWVCVSPVMGESPWCLEHQSHKQWLGTYASGARRRRRAGSC